MFEESPLSSFGPNKGMLVLLFILMSFFVVVSMAASRGSIDNVFYFFLSISFLSVAWFLWLLSIRVTFFKDGFLYKSIFGQKEILWQDVELIKRMTLRERVLFFPNIEIPFLSFTYFRFELVTLKGEHITFGNRFERPAEVGSRLIEFAKLSGRNIVFEN